MKTKLIFVRHGEATGNIDRIFHGFTDSELTDNGLAQIKRTAEVLSKETIDYIYSSGLKRAHQTACAIAEHHGLTVEVDPRFREINGGKWEKENWDELPNLYPEVYENWVSNPHLTEMPEGESMLEFAARLCEAVMDVIEDHAGKTICIATHGTSVRVLSCLCQNKPLEELNDVMWCDNASITIADYDDEMGFTLLVDGDNSHLGEISTIKDQDWWKIR